MRIELGLTMIAAMLLGVAGCDSKDDGSESGNDMLADGELTEGELTEGDPTDGDATEGDTEGETDDEENEAESCLEAGAAQSCGEGGLQYCYESSGENIWGECIDNPECTPGESRDCGLGEKFGDIDQRCRLEGGTPRWDEEACNTPLVLAFEPGAVQMTAASTASFDITGAGECITTDWPAAQTPWLAIDLDKSGAIDGGHELFGSGTVLPTGRHAANGFSALSELDSNGDGMISALDERFAELLLWSDHDGDRKSTLWELESLSQRGVESIELSHSSGRDCDERGNCAGERSSFTFAAAGRPTSGQVIDLYLACQ